LPQVNLAEEVPDMAMIAAGDKPLTYEEAVGGADAAKWHEAMAKEMAALKQMGTWVLQELPKGQRTVTCKWVFRIKRKADGSVDRYKARLVARGFTQEYGLNYYETFAPVAKHATIRMILGLAAHHDWELHQMDVDCAYLNAELAEEVYMEQPTGFVEEGKERLVCKMLRALYSLKQSGRSWNLSISRARL